MKENRMKKVYLVRGLNQIAQLEMLQIFSTKQKAESFISRIEDKNWETKIDEIEVDGKGEVLNTKDFNF